MDGHPLGVPFIFLFEKESINCMVFSLILQRDFYKAFSLITTNNENAAFVSIYLQI